MVIQLVFKSENTHQGQSIRVNEHELDSMIRMWKKYGYNLSDYWYLDMTRTPRP
jgi:hypothetical protein